MDETTGGQIELISEPMPIAIGPGLDADLTDAPAAVQAQAVLDQILQTAPIGDFPLCGGAVYDHGSQPLALSLDPADAPFPFEPGTTRSVEFLMFPYDCSGRGDVDLPAGEYEIWAFVPVAGDSPVSLVAGPWPVTVAP